MKSAEEWMEWLLDNHDKRGVENIRAIQADALRHAATMCKRSADNLVASEKLNPDGVLLLMAVRIEQVANELEEAK